MSCKLKGIFRNIVRFDRDEESDEALLLDKFVVFNASWAMVWLYVLGCMFASALIGMVPDLLAFATSPGTGLRQPAAIALLGVMLAGFIYPVIRLIVIPFQNLLEMAEAPIRKIRSGLRAGRGGQYTGAEVRSWLQQLPVFAGLDQAQIEDLGHSLRPARYAKGMNIILAGEEGTDFYLLVEGQAQVVVARRDRLGQQQVLVVVDAHLDHPREVAVVAGRLAREVDRADGRRAAHMLQINNEPVTVGGVWTRREGSGPHGRIEVEHDAQLTIGANRAADRLDGARALRHLRQGLGEAAVLEIDNEPVRPAQGEDVVLDGTAQVENDACFVIFRPYADILDRAARRSR